MTWNNITPMIELLNDEINNFIHLCIQQTPIYLAWFSFTLTPSQVGLTLEH